jgi:hypothetical protein
LRDASAISKTLLKRIRSGLDKSCRFAIIGVVSFGKENMREYCTIRALRRGEVVDLGGIKFKMDVDESGEEREIREGDLYIAERNTGPKLLTAAEVSKERNWIAPTTNDYLYDIWECVKVVEVE